MSRLSRRLACAALAAALLAAGCAAPPLPPGQPDAVDLSAAPRIGTADAVRLLEQSSFGPTPQAVERVRRQGVDGYLDEQLRLKVSRMPELPPVDNDVNKFCPVVDKPVDKPVGKPADGAASAPPPDPAQVAAQAAAREAARLCRRDHYSQFPLQARFFRNALTQPDQLRQRVAFALGQIFVVSARKNNRAYAMARYQQMLLDDAFGNYRRLLEDVTLSPMMGQYLDMANNERLDPRRGVPPNENYAREVLQLFSVGLVRLNIDGTPRRGADGRPLATYGPDEIREFARAFTGWTYPPRPGDASKRRNPAWFDGRLQPVPEAHDPGPKTLLGGQRIAGSADPRAELSATLDNIVGHPNVGPFIARRLIQHLTTSNPQPAYVARVARVFNDNGRGVRGDLGAVVRAVLTDPAARGDAPADPGFGKLREPVLYITGVMRALGAVSDGVDLIGQSAGMEENVFAAPSVFNFFPPDYELMGSNGAGVNAPELAIVDASTSLKRADFANRLIFGRPVPPDASVPQAVGTALTLAAWQPQAGDAAGLVDRLAALLLHQPLAAAPRSAIVQAVQTVPGAPAANAELRVKTAAYLLVTSPQYQVQR